MPPTAEISTAPASSTPDADMLAVAMAADAQTEPTTQTAAPAAAPQDQTGVPPVEGKDAKTPDAAPAAPAAAKPGETTDAPKAPAKKETQFEKAKGDAERKDRSWKALEEEKVQVRTEKAALQAELQGLRREVEQLRTAKPTGPAKDEHGATAEDYTALAKRYEAEGNDEYAAAARARAQKLSQPTGPRADNGAAFDSPEFQSKWREQTQQLIAKEPELADPANPLVKAANGILADPTYGRFFKSHPDGIAAAVEVARLMRGNAQAQETTQQLTTTKAELTKAQAEVTRLNSLLHPRGSHPAGQPGGAPKIEDMNAAEAQQAVLEMARAADRGELP
jgi:hypothetical protein